MEIPVLTPYVIPANPPAKEKPMPFDPATLKYDAAGLIPCMAQDAASGEVLMLAWMNEGAVAATLETGKVALDIPSPQTGKVLEVFVAEGEAVAEGQLLMTIEPV